MNEFEIERKYMGDATIFTAASKLSDTHRISVSCKNMETGKNKLTNVSFSVESISKASAVKHNMTKLTDDAK